MIVSLAVNLSPPTGTARLTLHILLALSALAALFLGAGPLLRESLGAARRGRIVFEQLFLLGITAALGASLVCTFTGTGHVYYEIVAILLAIHALGTALGRQRRTAALEAARALGEEFAVAQRLEPGGGLVSVPVTTIRPGDVVQIPPGAAIPIDGTILAGTALVDESALTGEPFPAVRRPEDPVRAGSRLVDGPLRVRATAAGDARDLDALFARVRAAQSAPSRLQRQADRLVAWFLPLVSLVALATFAFWTLQAGWTTGLFNALAVLLVACPCAMGLATPIGVWTALGALARHGLIAHSSDLVERLAQIRQIAFDKTGTLGDDRPELLDAVAAPGLLRADLLAGIAALEAGRDHPFARAFARFTGPLSATDVQLLPGVGLRGRLGPTELTFGNSAILPPGIDPAPLLAELRAGGASTHTLFLLRDGTLAGAFQLRECLRAATRPTLAALAADGLTCHVLTGDPHPPAHDLPRVTAALSPLAKADHLRALAAGGPVLFVGDGTNDAPAMAAAHASLALTHGAPLARDTATGELADLRALPAALRLCRATVRSIHRNLLFAAAYNAIGITLAAAGWLHPVAAALLMLGSSLTVSTRALRAGTRGEDAPTPTPATVSSFAS